MKGPTEILVLAGSARAAQAMEACVHAAGHEPVAVAHSVEEAMQAVAPGGPGRAGQPRPAPMLPDRVLPELVLIDFAQVREPANRAAVAELLRTLDVPAVYLTEHAQCLAPGAQAGEDDAPDERITAPLEPVALSLAIQLARYRQGYERFRARQRSTEPAWPEPVVTGGEQDTAAHRQAVEALRRSEERYALIFHMAAVPLWEVDSTALRRALEELRDSGVTDLRQYLDEHPEQIVPLIARTNLIDINEEGLKLFGAESREQMVHARHQIFIPASLPGAREVLIAHAEGKEHHESEIPYRTFRGEHITVLLRVSFPSRERGLESMLLSAVDITARKRTEDKIRQLNADLRRHAAELQTANTELESFSYSVSHDLRAPLRAIDGFSTAILDEYGEHLDDQGRGYLERVCRASRRMSQLIDDLLELSRMSRSSMHLETCHMSDMAHSIVRALRKAQPEREVEVTIEPDMRVHADPTLLRVVLDNLLGNAWKFTSKQPRAHLHLGTTRHDGRRAFFVRDDGAGFDMQYMDKLFGAFQRLHGAHEFAGTGIGLATVKRIIRRHGGDIWAEGEVGEGATFTFTLA